MASIIYIVLLSMILGFIFIWRRCRDSKGKKIPTNWPIIGMTPGLIANIHRIHDFVTDFLEESGGTCVLKGPWFSNVDIFLTCDPANIHHILSKKFPNYGKGPLFKKIFACLGDGMFIAEGESWEFQRRTTHAILHHQGFLNFMVTSTSNKVQKGMIPLLDHFAKLGTNVDLQEIFQRFTFDLSCVLLLDCDPVSLNVEFPKFPIIQAFNDCEEGILFRYLLPETIWKLQEWLQIGKEKKLSKGIDIIDEFLANQIASKREKLNEMGSISSMEAGFDFLSGYTRLLEEKSGACASNIPDKVLRDTLFNLIFAGKDTFGVALTWFFWLMATNPTEENKIREEITKNLHEHEVGGLNVSKVEELDKLAYLHGAICETLRLFSPVPLQPKSPIEADILPSGHCLKPNTTSVLCFYSTGRMEHIWGKDSLEFKPSRWISERGGIKHVPSFKFTAFNAGPRSCLGKEMSFIQLKMVAATLIYHFEFKVVEGQTILPSSSVILHLKNGSSVRVSRRAIHH